MGMTETLARIVAQRSQDRASEVPLATSEAEIFISYAMPDDDALASHLEIALEAKQFRTWRATRISGGEVPHLAIRRALRAALAVIVLWTPKSIELQWVYSEATLAHGLGRLIPLRTPDVALHDIPQPFNTVQTLDVGDLRKVEIALARLGVLPTRAV